MKRQSFKRIKDNEAKKNTKGTLWQEKNRVVGKQIPKLLYRKTHLKKYQHKSL